MTSRRIDTIRVTLGPQAKAPMTNTSTILPVLSPFLVLFPSSPKSFLLCLRHFCPTSFYFRASSLKTSPHFHLSNFYFHILSWELILTTSTLQSPYPPSSLLLHLSHCITVDYIWLHSIHYHLLLRAGVRNTTKMITWVAAVMWGAKNQARLSPQGLSLLVSASPVFITVSGKEQVLRTRLLCQWQNAVLLGATQRKRLLTLPKTSASVHSDKTWPFGEEKKKSL